MNHVKILKSWPSRDVPSKLVQLWYKSFPIDQRGLVKMKNPTRLSNKTSTAWSCAEDQILENENLRKMILNICTGRWVKNFFEIYLPLTEHTWLIGSGGYHIYIYICIYIYIYIYHSLNIFAWALLRRHPCLMSTDVQQTFLWALLLPTINKANSFFF